MSVSEQSDVALIHLIGDRIARYRLNRNLTQETLADEAGVSRATLARLEQGHSTSLTNLLRILRALGLADNLDALIPEPPHSPVAQLRTRKKQRMRASSHGSPREARQPWRWGEET